MTQQQQGDATMTSKQHTLTILSDIEVEVTRVFDAPRELVFKAYTDPELVPKWWGWRGNVTTVDVMDVTPGGKWRYVQRSPDGQEFAFHGEYREVVPPERLVSTFEFEGMPGHITEDALTLVEENGRTTLTARSTFSSKEDRDGMLGTGMEDGATETYSRLDEVLATLQQ
jgi:uncharacterized protein YndB with AHSA1/START domain